MHLNYLIAFILLGSFHADIYAQSSNKIVKRFDTHNQLTLDSLTVLEHSIIIQDTMGQIVNVPFKLVDNILFLDTTYKNLPTVLEIKFSVLPFHLGQSISLIDTSNLSSKNKGQYSFYDYQVKKSNTDNLFGTKSLDYEGSFLRGISFGNAQNLIYDAAFNLQMAGTIGDGISLRAAISDNQIPIQPEGNTQQIQEFDQIFIEISKKGHSLLAGDFDVQSKDGYFMRYNKKLKGISYNFKPINKNKDVIMNSRTSTAISKGRFNRQALNVREGNQGPYKLLGKQGERFIIVIAGSEKVIVDGRIIKRGHDGDYTVDYNLGEISFTVNMPITVNSRVFVEFEYLDQQYSRTLLTSGNSMKWKKISSYFNIYHQQDSKTPSVNFGTTFDSTTLNHLSDLPESTDKLFVPGTRLVNADTQEEEVRYEMRDTFFIVAGRKIDTTILFYVENNTSTGLFTSKFTELGLNNGDYTIKNSTLNGRVYQWVAPDSVSGESRGNYSPVVTIVPPSTHQMIEGGVNIDFSPHLNWHSNLALSRLDLNRYSSLNEENDIGVALRSGLTFSHPLSSSWDINTNIIYEFRSLNFSAIEPYKNAEFNRNWNITNTNSRSEHHPMLDLELKQLNGNIFNYNFQGLYLSEDYNGNKHNWSTNLDYKGWNLVSHGSMLNNDNQFEKSKFFKPEVSLHKRFKKLNNTIIGIESLLEQNLRKDLVIDTLLGSSFYFFEMSPYIENDLNKKLKFNFKYTYREDKISKVNRLTPLSQANNLTLFTNWKPSKKTNLTSSFNFRSLQTYDDNNEDLKNTQTLLGKSTLNTQLFQGALKWVTRYEVSSGQEPKSEFVFTEVRSGEGNFIYNDFNNDGIAQFNEYILAPYADTANYIKLRLFNNEFIRTDHVILEQSIVVDPRQSIINQKKELSLWNNWMIRSTYKSSKKTTAATIQDAWNPFATGINDSNLIIDLTIFNALFVFRPSDEIYDIQFKHAQRKSKQILTTGFEIQRTLDYIGKLRWNIIKEMDVRLESGRVLQWADSENFDNRDYNIISNYIQTKINYRWKNKLRFGLSYEMNIKDNRGLESVDAQIQNLQFETTIKKSAKHSFNINLNYAQVEYDGQIRTALELIILNGLKPGNNYIWNIRYDQKITPMVFMNISYNGRKTGDSRIFHTGNVQMRAIF